VRSGDVLKFIYFIFYTTKIYQKPSGKSPLPCN